VAGFFLSKELRKKGGPSFKVICLVSSLWLANFLFFAYASASLLRYELFMVVIEFVFGIYAFDLMYEMEKTTKDKTAYLLDETRPAQSQ
jgi:hypothetical protein